MKDELDDILGDFSGKKTLDDLDDILGDLGKKKKPKRKRGWKKQPNSKAHKPLVEPAGGGHPDGIFRLWKRKEKTFLRECIICDADLPQKPHAGRPRTICRKKSCFRAYRNAYRLDYDAQRPS